MQHVNIFKVLLKYVSNDVVMAKIASSIEYIYFGNKIGIQPSLNIIKRQHIRHCRKYWI